MSGTAISPQPEQQAPLSSEDRNQKPQLEKSNSNDALVDVNVQPNEDSKPPSNPDVKPKDDLKDLKTTTHGKNFKELIDEEHKQQIKPEVLIDKVLKGADYDKNVTHLTAGDSRFRVSCVTPDNKHVALFNENELIVLDVKNKTPESLFKGTGNYAPCFMGAIDDNTLLTLSQGGNLRTWNFKEKITGPISTTKVFPSNSCAAFSKDKKYLVVANNHIHSIEVLDIEEKKVVRKQLEAHNNPIYSLVVTEDGKHIVSGSDDHSIKIWTYDEIELVHPIPTAHPGGVTALQVTKDCKTMISGCTDGVVTFWDFKTKKKIHTVINAHEKIIENMSISSDGELLFTASLDGTLKLWSIPNRLPLHSFKNVDNNELWCVVTTNETKEEGRFTVAAGEKSTILILDAGKPKNNCMAENTHRKLIDDLNLTPDGRWLVSGGDDGFLKVWNVEEKKLEFEMQKNGGEFWKFAICCDNDKVSTGCSNGQVDLWSLKERKMLFTYSDKHVEGLSCVRFTKDGTKLLACAEADGIYVHDAHSDKLLNKVIDPREDDIFIIDTTSDDRYYVSGSRYKSIAIWDAQEELKIAARIVNAHDGAIWSLRLTPNDELIISGGTDAKIKAWDFQTRKLVYLFDSKHVSSIRGLDISRDNFFVISTAGDGYMEVHNLKLKQRVFAYSGQRKEGERSLGAVISNDNQDFFFSTLHSLFVIDNPMTKLAVQSSDESLNYPLVDPMPLTSFFSNTNTENRMNLIKYYPELKLHPYGWNWFHIVAFFAPNKELVRACLMTNIPFKIDMFKRTPLHYLIGNEQSQVASINLVLSRFGQVLHNSQRPFEVLETLSDIIPKIIELNNIHILSFFKHSFREPEPAFENAIDNYGKIKGEKYGVCFSDSVYYNKKVKENLIKDSLREKVSIQVLPFYMNFTLTSDTMKDLVQALKKVTVQEIFEDKFLSFIVGYLWMRTKSFYYSTGLLFSIQAILISVYAGLGEENLGLEIAIFIISMLFLLYEIFEIMSSVRGYFSSIWNYVDIASNLLLPGTLIADWCGLEGDVRNWLFSFILSFTYTRWVSYFRVFRQTRRLIRMIIEIIKDIRSFAVILAFIIFGLSLIFLQFDKDNTFSTHLLNSYRLLFSDFDLENFSSPGMLFYFLIIIAVLAIVFLNMLITLMADTFAEVQKNSLIVNSSELLELIEEGIRVRRSLRMIFISKKRRDAEEIKGKRYLYVAEQVMDREYDSDGEENTETKIKKIEEKIELMQPTLMSIQQDLNKLLILNK